MKLHRYVNDSSGQVMEGLSNLLYPLGLRNKGLITQIKTKFNMHLHSFQDTELNLHRYVDDSLGQVVEGLTILRYPWGSEIKG